MVDCVHSGIVFFGGGRLDHEESGAKIIATQPFPSRQASGNGQMWPTSQVYTSWASQGAPRRSKKGAQLRATPKVIANHLA